MPGDESAQRYGLPRGLPAQASPGCIVSNGWRKRESCRSMSGHASKGAHGAGARQAQTMVRDPNKSEPPSAELAKATGYAINQWTALTRFVDDGRLSLDNNLCEQQMRAIALGRRNYLFCGSHDAARCTAILYGHAHLPQYDVPPLPTSRTCSQARRRMAKHPRASSRPLDPDRLPHKHAYFTRSHG